MVDWSRVQSPLDRQKQAFVDLCRNAAKPILNHPYYQSVRDLREAIRAEKARDITPPQGGDHGRD